MNAPPTANATDAAITVPHTALESDADASRYVTIGTRGRLTDRGILPSRDVGTERTTVEYLL